MKSILGGIGLFLLAQWAYGQCQSSTYYCLNPEGSAIGTVGPVNMWYNQDEAGCIASPVSKKDACLYLNKLCNNNFPNICHGDCLAGDSTTYIQERSCVNATPIAPDSSQPTERHEIWFIK